MIRYTEKGIGLHEAISAAGHWLEQRNGEWVSSDDAAVQQIIDNYTLDDCKARIVAEIDAHATNLRNMIVAGYSPAEMASWPIKRAEALAFQQSGNQADAPILSAEAATRGVSLAQIVMKVLMKAQQLTSLEAAIAGNAGRHGDAVRATNTFEEALNYDWRTGWPV
jgi:hypothetical protein